jgi:hypothetical protein
MHGPFELLRYRQESMYASGSCSRMKAPKYNHYSIYESRYLSHTAAPYMRYAPTKLWHRPQHTFHSFLLTLSPSNPKIKIKTMNEREDLIPTNQYNAPVGTADNPRFSKNCRAAMKHQVNVHRPRQLAFPTRAPILAMVLTRNATSLDLPPTCRIP